MEPDILVSEGATTYSSPSDEPTAWVDHLRGARMSLGTYSIPAGGSDDQQPHREDEIYVVTGGRATLLAGGQAILVRPGTAVHVPAEVEHRFVDVTEDLTVLVVFSPPYSGR